MYDESALEKQLRTARSSLREAQDAARTAEPPAPVTVERADGRIRVTVGAEGRVTGIEVDPVALREGIEFVTGEIVTAVNAALDAQTPAVPAGAVPDFAPLFATVERAQDEGLRQMRAMTTSINEAMRRLGPGSAR